VGRVWLLPVSLRVSLSALALIPVLAGAPRARAVTITVTGADGVDAPATKPPTQPEFGLQGQAGGDAPPAQAQAVSADPDNRAVATGGKGGAGGPGGDSQATDGFGRGGPGGRGGAGGTASATSTTDVPTGDASATSLATGGAGGPGGPWGSPLSLGQTTPATIPGPEGDSNASATAQSLGGSATSDAEATHGQSTAVSNAQANGGLASATALSSATGAGKASSAQASGIAQGDSQVVSRATGLGHAASVSTAESHQGSAGASAEANGTGTTFADVNADASANAEDGDATATAKATGIGYESSSAGSYARAHASAVTHGPGNALASATAFPAGAGVGTPSLAGKAQARAEAISEQGDATARVVEGSGGGQPPQILYPGRVDEFPYGGGPSDSEELVDAVHGSAAGTLTLSQEAQGGFGGTSGGGAHSVLHAQNPAGGAIVGEAIARGGSGAYFEYPNQWSSSPGNANADVTALDTQGSRARAHALAVAGQGESLWSLYYGGAIAHASAEGLGEVEARAEADGGATGTDALAAARGTGPVVGGHSEVMTTLPTASNGYSNYLPTGAWAGVHDSAPLGITRAANLSLTQLGPQVAAFAAPLASDVAAWSAGSSHAQEALQGKTVLGLGSVAHPMSSSSNAGISGSLVLDLDAASFADGTDLQLAFLHSYFTGDSLDMLHLRFSIDGRQVFEESATGAAAAAAALEDTVVDLGALGSASGALRELELDFDLGALPNVSGQFSFDFAVATPEPSALGLLSIATLTAAAARRRTRGARKSLPRA
jgi:hypothetical protein